MDMYTIKFTRLQSEIFRLFCIKAGMSLNQRETARFLKVSPTAISKSLPLLEKENLIRIKKDKRMNLMFIELDRDSEKAINFKRAENVRMIYESGLVGFLEDSFPGCTIILFGSYSRGDDILSESEGHKSDIDIAIIGAKSKEIELTKFEELLERIITVNSYLSFKEIHKNLKDNILNGILLSGTVEL
ncbi:MAG: nucleotidyltransferase domain-containing protein [Candidatus Pacearchaeota archaeon]|nr:nucleotidyltransferase domain-containing protein [Candidatus Pacearchaeota archaeon]